MSILCGTSPKALKEEVVGLPTVVGVQCEGVSVIAMFSVFQGATDLVLTECTANAPGASAPVTLVNSR